MENSANRDGTDASDGPLHFEAALEELQQIVSDMENGTLGLNDSLKRFERGVSLLQTCHKILEEAEQKIELLIGIDPEGNATTAPFDGSATANHAKPAAGKRSQAKKSPKTRSEPDRGDKQDRDSEPEKGGSLFP